MENRRPLFAKLSTPFKRLTPLRKEILVMSLLSLVATVVLFHDYLYPWKRVQLWSDTAGFHWPLLNYAFTSLKEGRFPLWDPSMYCGIPFAGNITAGLFYPPNWLMFASQWHRPTLPFIAVETLAVAHVWMAFVFAYCWLRMRASHWLPAAMGAAVVGYSGYMLSQIVHLGVICGYAWMPFGLWGIEEAHATGRWQPLWKVAVGLAMALLAGYPATFIAFVLLAFAYALALQRRWRLISGVLVATVVAILLCAVQILPIIEAVSYKVPEARFGAYPNDYPRFYLSFLLPNLYDQNRTHAGPEVAEADYMYLGAAGLLGLLFLLRYPFAPWARQALIVAGVFLLFLENPWGIISRIVYMLPVLPDAMRSYNLFAGLAFPAGLLTMGAADAFLKLPEHPALSSAAPASWVSGIWTAAALSWASVLLVVARKGGPEFSHGLASGWYALGTFVLLAGGLLLFRSRRQVLIAVVLLGLMLCEYRVFGVNRKFNAVAGSTDQIYAADFRLGGRSLLGLDDQVFDELRANPDRRIAVFLAPHTTDLRHYRLATPQGFDPFVTVQYKAAVERFRPFRTDREFEMDIRNPEMLQTFGTGYVMVRNGSGEAKLLRDDPGFKLLEPADSFYQVFAIRDAQPAWRFEAGDARMAEWSPERRVFEVDSSAGGAFALLEQHLPGWSVTVDGQTQPLKRWDGTFQAVDVPAGKHRIEFRYLPQGLAVGAGISLLALCGGILILCGPFMSKTARAALS